MTPSPPRPSQHGFSLVEMAIVMVIVGLLLGGLLTPLATQIEQRKVSATRQQIDEVKEALAGFAVRYGYLPCPAVSAANGIEDRSGHRCTGARRVGLLPWVTLGLPKLDAWGRVLRYSVTPAFADSGTLFTLATPRDISIATRDSNGRLVAATATDDIPAVVLSAGKNGSGGVSDAGVPVAAALAANADERVNAESPGTVFVSRGPSDNPAAPGGQFDDIVAWLSPNILFNRMVSARALPR